MNDYNLLASIFAEHIELHSDCATQSVQQISLASETIANSLLTEKKVLCCGSGNGDLLAQLFCSHLIYGHDEERPTLPAMYLSNNKQDSLAKQISAFGYEGDSLFILPTEQNIDSIVAAINTARERNIFIILCTNNEALISLLNTTDIEIVLPSANAIRSLEMQTTVIHSICQLIDSYIFGGTP